MYSTRTKEIEYRRGGRKIGLRPPLRRAPLSGELPL
nr:MAG TPA: hypothetical protein [Microviridae sp.]